jgi:hypothetical protein
MNGTWILVLGVLLPLSLVVVARQVFTEHPRAAVWVGLLAPTPAALALLNGVMSYAMALALIPAALALVLRRMTTPGDVPAAVLAVVLASLFISHPSAALTAGIVIACVVLGQVAARSWDKVDKVAIARLLPCAAAALVLILPWYRAAGSAGVGGAAIVAAKMTTPDALSAALRLSTPWAPGQLILAGMVILGAVATIVWRSGRGVLVAYAIFLAGYFSILAGFAPIAQHTGLWYGQWYRLFGVVGLLVPLLAAAGIELLVGGLRRVMAAGHRTAAHRAAVAGLVVVALVGGLGTARYLLRNEGTLQANWELTTVTDEDRGFFDEVGRIVGPDEQVLNNWADGSTWMYAVAGVTPAIPYVSSTHSDYWAAAVLYDLASLPGRPDLCRTMLDRKILFALAKNTINDGAPNSFAAEFAAHPELYREAASSSSTTLYSIDRSELERCASSG